MKSRIIIGCVLLVGALFGRALLNVRTLGVWHGRVSLADVPPSFPSATAGPPQPFRVSWATCESQYDRAGRAELNAYRPAVLSISSTPSC
jgi:hypothetical protein